MMAWIMAIILLPYLGALIYLLIGDPRIRRKTRERRRRRRIIAPTLSRQLQALTSLQASPESFADDLRMADLVKIATRVGQNAPTRGNAVSIYHDAERTYSALHLAIESAKSHVHMQYYIFQPDDTGRRFCDQLIRKAGEGVRCRVLLDGVGSWPLTREFLDAFAKGGVEVVFFLPVRLGTRKLHFNLRNHRKLVIVDGTVAFTGSQNIGDEYLGRKRRLGPWRDTHLRIEGPASTHLQEVFVEDWFFASGQDLAGDDSLFPPGSKLGGCVAQIVATGPDRANASLHMLLLAALTTARHSIAITTPYFVPDIAIMLALQVAAIRGVQVQLLLPSQSDVWLVLWAGRSYYEELIQAGVEIYEYEKTMLHSKVVVIDETWAMVGSANMDIRSFRLNFELTTLLYDRHLARLLYDDFRTLRDAACRVSQESVHWNWRQSLAIGVARLASPLL